MTWEADQDSSLHGDGASMRQVVYLDIVLLQQGTEDGLTKSAKHVKPDDFPFFISSSSISYHFPPPAVPEHKARSPHTHSPKF